jgi:hypothetical protein
MRGFDRESTVVMSMFREILVRDTEVCAQYLIQI